MTSQPLTPGSILPEDHPDVCVTTVFQRNRKPRLALVGNAPLKRDLSQQIDSSDLVVRCNEAKTLGGYSGTRTDILCISNTGAPARRIIDERSVRKAKFSFLSEVWFPRVIRTHLRYLRASGYNLPESEFDDCSARILEANDLADARVTFFSKDFNERVFSLLRQKSRWRFVCPSTGFLALWYILEQYASFDKFMFGFSFKFWDGHPAAAEKQIVEELCIRDDFYFVPVS